MSLETICNMKVDMKIILTQILLNSTHCTCKDFNVLTLKIKIKDFISWEKVKMKYEAIFYH